MRPEMRIRFVIALLGVVAIVVVSPRIGIGDVPQQISFQGNLTDDTGNPLNGNYVMVFSIYDVSSGGTAIWWEQQTATLIDGICNVLIGQDPTGNPFPSDLFDGQRWLGVAVGTDAEMEPRQLLTATPYAMRAEVADDADTLDGMDSLDFAENSHSHNFTEVIGLATDAQIPDDITINYATNANDASTLQGSSPSDFAASVHNHDNRYYTESELNTSAGAGQVHWNNLVSIPAGFADGVDNNSGGDITGVSAGTGLTGGGTSGSVSLNVDIPLSITGSNSSPILFGINTGNGMGVAGQGTGIGAGVRGRHATGGNWGYLATSAYGVYGSSSSGTAGYFDSSSGYGLLVNRGNVGIGTSAPETKLEIAGDGTSWRRGFICIKNLDQDAGIRLYDSYDTVKHHIFNLNNENDILRIAPAGSYGTGGITIAQSGNVGIGTLSPNNRLDVLGTIRAEEIIVDTGWADYVFKDDYVRMDLDQVENYIKLKKQLPGMPTESEVKKNGIGVGAFQTKLLEKIEELTLYLIEQNKQIKRQNNKIYEQNQKLSDMKQELDALRNKVSLNASMAYP